ncbi:alpha/beta fold hydrolase [Streptomyces sp. TG1A-8]|uniref:thioesterase II family protein n=1 Tax=Streptomyces sp. TG1A-8 TaxID=3051385 RepID=UPI00265BDAC4|nr:alpha/beta fold hydrolase [Streptomyces sp. TG1A-8]MDO0928745.1 alpha/beta fold hydrolase [Streptomyces sp. TG1A-8]
MPSARLRLVCLPHAGGSAGFFGDWSAGLAPDVELWAIQYPGRENRIGEPFIAEMDVLAQSVADELHPHAGTPTVIFGHSMGAALGFEVARRLTTPGEQHAMRHLVVSGCAAPHRLRPFPGQEGAHLLDDERLVAMLGSLGAGGTHLLDDPDLREVLLPPVRNDYRLVQSYTGRRDPALPIGITAFAGRQDAAVSIDELDAWAEVTDGRCTVRSFPGGHFYLTERRDEVLGALNDVLDGLG